MKRVQEKIIPQSLEIVLAQVCAPQCIVGDPCKQAKTNRLHCYILQYIILN